MSAPPPDRAQLRERYEQRLRLMVPAEMELLKDLPLFAGIPEKAREKVVDKVRKYIHLSTYARGDVILREGDYGDSAYYVVSGTVGGGARPSRRGEPAASPARAGRRPPCAAGAIARGRGRRPSG